MKYSTPCLVYSFWLLIFLVSCNRGSKEYDSKAHDALKEGFIDPTGTARPKVYWWWLNGYSDTVRIKEELSAIKAAGLGGVDLFEIGVPPVNNPGGMVKPGPAFMSAESLENIAFALEEASKLDLEVGLNLASSWNAGGSWVTPEHAAKTIYHSKTTLKGGTIRDFSVPFPSISDKSGDPRTIEYGPDKKPVFYEEIALLAIPSNIKSQLDTNLVIDITSQFDKDKEFLNWEAPVGDWDIYRFVCSNSGEQLLRPSENSQGPIIDHFDAEATEMHINYFIDKFQPKIGDFSKSALKYLYLASYEAKDLAWTQTFPEVFASLNGYPVIKFLPGLIHPELYDPETLRRFHHDYAETFSELMINNHYGKAREIANAHGLNIISESGGPGHMHHIPVETLKALGALDIPRGEFWYERPFYDEDSVDMVWLVKEIAAASHIYKQKIVEQEAFTSYWDWQEGPADLKPFADRAFAEGMNRLVIHGFTHNPGDYGHPGIVYFAGTHFNDKRVWWPKIKPFTDYLSRVSYILQNTDFVADVLYYYGEEIPNLVPPKNTRFMVGAGYDYEVINQEKLMEELRVEDGKLVLPGVSKYKLLYVDEQEMSLSTLEKIKSLADRGALVIGNRPERVIGLPKNEKADSRVKEMADEIWKVAAAEESLEDGGLIENLSPLKALETMGLVHDFDYSDNHPDQRKAPLDFIHYQKETLDFYFIRNTTDKWVTRNCFFRQVGKKPEMWDPISGSTVPVTIFEESQTQTKIPVSLAPYGSTLVVFSPGSSDVLAKEINRKDGLLPNMEFVEEGLVIWERGSIQLKNVDGEIQEVENLMDSKTLEGEWLLEFPHGQGAPSGVKIDHLKSWTEFEDTGIQYFSGMGTYTKTFMMDTLQEDRIYFLDLGELAEVAEVWINEKSLGLVWTAPYRFRLHDFLKEGENEIKIELANTWSNRLTRDAITGEKFTETNIVRANKNLVPWENLPLKKSGLIGPVEIIYIKPLSL